jgi:hypothetical protein
MEASLVVEDVLQEVVFRKMIQTYRPDIDIVNVSGKCGNLYIRNNIKTFNDASQYLPYIVVTGLDIKLCAPQLIREWITFDRNENMLFRVVEKEIEAWIMSDRETFAEFMGIPDKTIPINTQAIPNPKQFILSLARTSNKKEIKKLLPQGMALQGPAYDILLYRFVLQEWDAEKAQSYNKSLRKAIMRLETFLL